LTATWGQWDSVSVFFMVAALWLLLRGNPEWALPVLIYASLIKPQMAALIPIVLIAWWRWYIQPPRDADHAHADIDRRRHVEQLALAALASLAVFVVVAVPFNVGVPPLPTRWTIFERMRFALDRFPVVSENGYNLWTILGHASASSSVNDGQAFLLGLSYQRSGSLLLAAAMLTILALFWRRPTRSMALWAALATTFALFMLPTRIHERYLLPAVVLALLVSAVAPHLRWLGITLSLSYLVNIYMVYHQVEQRPFGDGAVNDVALGIASVNLFLFLVVMGVGFTLARQPVDAHDEAGELLPRTGPLPDAAGLAIPGRSSFGSQAS
jgi:Gpi18-like mannosyltransferase